MTRKEILDFWIKSSDTDFKVMNCLYKENHYAWALFIGHLVLEKLLKAHYVKKVGIEVPYTHDLNKIADLSNLNLTEEQKDFLDEVTTFNIRARYPDYKNRFYKKATKEFAERYVKKIRNFRLWLKKVVIS
ncbi:MAG: HEPN domain-containing protein [Proteobacteria bacterium]|nr:HEPN domain-containing protein [Pseudomonadota bacterium]